MKLEAYLKMTGESGNAFAKRSGIGQTSISRYIADCDTPRAVQILLIERATRGAVTWRDWVADLEAELEAVADTDASG